MNRPLPPYPTGDLREWATQLVGYLVSRERNQDEVIPFPVPLQHKIGDERAIDDGIMMYDPNLQLPVVSIGGVWEPIALDVAQAAASTIQPLVLTDAYQPLVLDNPVPLDSGTYVINISTRVLGTGGNAEYQTRITDAGVPVVTGQVISIGNNEIQQSSFEFLAATNGALAVEMRGNNATLEAAAATLVRIGQ